MVIWVRVKGTLASGCCAPALICASAWFATSARNNPPITKFFILFSVYLQLKPGLGTRVLDLPVRYLARNYFYKWLTVFDAHGSETGGGRQKTAEISFDCRPKI